jgi:phytoene dehydrogenase-like protein
MLEGWTGTDKGVAVPGPSLADALDRRRQPLVAVLGLASDGGGMTDVVVAGGGLAGLVAARKLAREGTDVTLFEREATVGGRVQSAREGGFTIDRGFQVLFTEYPAVRTELDLDALSLRRFRPGAILARPGKRSTLADPLGDPRALTATLLNREVTVRDKLRVLGLRRELARTPHAALFDRDDASIAASLSDRGFSEQFVSNFAAPFYGGITLDRSLSTSRFVFEYTFKMLAEGAIAVPADGMGAIPAQLAASARDAGVRIETETPVSAVRNDEDGVVVGTNAESVAADAAVVATDPHSARELTGCESVPTGSRSCVTQQFSLPATQELDTGGRLVLNAADARPNQVAPMSAVAPEYAPAGMQLLSATFLGEQSASDEELTAEVREALAGWYPENSSADLELLRTDRIAHAQTVQPPRFTENRPAVDDPDGSVYLAGDYTEWSSIQGAMVSGRRAARAVLQLQ